MVFNSSNKLLSTQRNTSNIQQGINLATRYLTRDLETSTSFEYINVDENESGTLDIEDNNIPYSFRVNDKIEYEVTTTQKGDIYLYSLNRKYESSSINIISNQPISQIEEAPIQIIQAGEKDDLFKVTINYLDKNKTKSYKFDVYKRVDN